MNEKPRVGSSRDFPPVIAAMPINKRESKIALGVVVFLLSVLVMVAPLASMSLPRVDVFIPVLQAVMCVIDLITAAFLFAQYSIYPKRALLAVASGYVFSGLFAFLQTLVFPGAYSATGLIGDGIDTAGWLFVLWQTTFVLSVLVYALSKDVAGIIAPVDESTTAFIGITIASVLTATVGLTWIVTEGAGYLPRLYLSATKQTPFASGLDVFLWLLSIAAFVLLFVRRRTILDLWLIVILLAWWPNFAVAIFVPVVRFSLGWYAARCFSLVASSTLLIVLLAETMVLYGRLARSNMMLERERDNKLMNMRALAASISHELKQPLAAVTMSGAAGLRWLERMPPDFNEVRSNLGDIVHAGHRAGKVLDNLRALFGKADWRTEPVDLNQVALTALRVLREEINDHGVATSVELESQLPLIMGHRVQLEEVIVNLAHNAVEAMDAVDVDRRLLILRTEVDGHNVVVGVEDTGPGINQETLQNMFGAFATTKPQGMGLGLAICSMIIEGHCGRLSATSDGKNGALIKFFLPMEVTERGTARAE
jgi:signal transduction histidine kinase